MFASVVVLAGLAMAACARAEGPPVVVGRADPVPKVFFDGRRNRCDRDDFPDAPARAFRDKTGTVHLLATHHVNRQMLGPTLHDVVQNCDVIHRGRNDPRPESYDDYGWLVAPYTLDGTTVYSLVHNEFHGSERPALCPSRVSLRCWENAITWAVSRDGGFSFTRPPGPGSVVASLPYRYAGDRPKQIGYFNPTNIVARDGFFYAMFLMIDPVQKDWGICLARTPDLADPTSWRAWDGSGFTVRNANPYLTPEVDPTSHRCRPVGSGSLFGSLGSISWMPQAGLFVLTMRFQTWDKVRRAEVPGVYIATSANLIDWSLPTLLMADQDVGAPETLQLYPALLDPDAPDRNFETISDRPLLFTVVSERRNAVNERKLVARQIELEVSR